MCNPGCAPGKSPLIALPPLRLRCCSLPRNTSTLHCEAITFDSEIAINRRCRQSDTKQRTMGTPFRLSWRRVLFVNQYSLREVRVG